MPLYNTCLFLTFSKFAEQAILVYLWIKYETWVRILWRILRQKQFLSDEMTKRNTENTLIYFICFKTLFSFFQYCHTDTAIMIKKYLNVRTEKRKATCFEDPDFNHIVKYLCLIDVKSSKLII